MILNLMKKTYSPLIFSLFCGLIYFGLAFCFIIGNTQNGGLLLSLFFFPAIVCGAAYFVVKMIKMCIEEENEKKLNVLFWSHIVLAFVSTVLVSGVLI